MLAHEIQTLGDNPKERKQYSQQNKSLKSRMLEEFHHLITSNKPELIYILVKTEPRDILHVKSFASL